jgi:endonuclease YncB( thermonuclease family)
MKKTREFDAIIDRVVDGDTVRVRVDLGFRISFAVIVRLENVSAEEITEPKGVAQFAITKKLLPEQTPILLISTKIDSFGRSLGVIVRRADKFNVNEHLAEKFKN